VSAGKSSITRRKCQVAPLYIEFLRKLNLRTIRIVDNPRLLNRIAALKRRTARGGKDSMDLSARTTTSNVVAGPGLLRGHPLYVERA
jgi:hypothetical protein